jgi:hypothetical protein
MNRTAKTVAATALLLGALAAGACSVPGYWEGGSRASNDLHTYVSRPYAPKTISLVNTVTGETLWSVDVPVGKQLVIRFNDNKTDDPVNSSIMWWDIMEVSTDYRSLQNKMPVPAPEYRRIDMELRDAPEYPESADAGG